MNVPFKVSPLTIVREGIDGREAMLAVTLEFEDDESDRLAIVKFTDWARDMPIAEMLYETRDEVAWVGIAGSVFTARPIRPGDAVLADVYGYDLPEPVLQMIAMGTMTNQMTLQAVVDQDDNRVLTLLLATDAGLFARYDALWHPVADPEIFSGSYLVEVTEDAIQLYDGVDTIGGQLPASSLPTGPNETDASIPLPSDIETAITASAIPVIEDEESLLHAITAAAEDPTIRWYVERRAKALGSEVELPW